jgi:pimeloyl-[acyl-carrier protein] methyl ester esterase
MPTTRLVLLPGMDGTGILFEPLLEVLPRRLDAQVVQYPPDKALGYEALLDVVQDAIPVEGPFVLLGESFSGPLALMTASNRPSGLQAVVLCASFVQSPLPWFPRAFEALVTATTLALVPAFVRERALLGRHATPKLSSLLARAHRCVTLEAMAARARAILRVDVSSALRACPVPLLYIRAKDDRVVSVGSWKLIAENRPDACVEVVPGPHLILQTNPVAAVIDYRLTRG